MTEQKNKRSDSILGILLILFGFFLLSAQFGWISWENIWPVFLIVGGIMFYLGFLANRNNYGLLMPGSILTVIGVLFLYTSAHNWHQMEVLWPTFILAPGIGFVLMYIFGPKGNGLWIPAGILIIIALVFYAQFSCFFRYWPVILIIIGIFIIFNGMDKKSKSKSKDTIDFTDT